jgi:hypothetical protein
VKEKASEITTTAKEPLTSHVHHVKIQNRYNTNPDVYSILVSFIQQITSIDEILLMKNKND